MYSVRFAHYAWQRFGGRGWGLAPAGCPWLYVYWRIVRVFFTAQSLFFNGSWNGVHAHTPFEYVPCSGNISAGICSLYTRRHIWLYFTTRPYTVYAPMSEHVVFGIHNIIIRGRRVRKTEFCESSCSWQLDVYNNNIIVSVFNSRQNDITNTKNVYSYI